MKKAKTGGGPGGKNTVFKDCGTTIKGLTHM